MTVRKKQILVIDDHEDCCEMLRIFFGDDYQVVVIQDAIEGLSFAKRNCFDLYLLDWVFPNKAALELCRQIRNFDVETPLIFWSGDSRELSRQEALQNGAAAFLVKPVDLENLAETVASLIDTNSASTPNEN